MVLDAKIFAFLSLLAVQVFVSIVYKFSQQKGTYAYSPVSAIAAAEFIKLCISSVLFFYQVKLDERSTTLPLMERMHNRFKAGYASIRKEVNTTFIMLTCGLASLYVINNQLAFLLFLIVDIASISMFKSFSSFIAAILLWAFFKRQITREQWASIILQVIGLCIVQYDACKQVPILAAKYYLILIGSTLITAISSVANERLIKTYSVNIHVQNAILYSFGLTFNLALFIFAPGVLSGTGSHRKHFFEGYSIFVLAIIFSNSLLGIVITFVYKYADAIVKTFSTACATGVLLYINVAVFHLKTNLTVILGAIVIFVSAYIFLLAKPDPSVAPVQNQENLIAEGEKDTTFHEDRPRKDRWKFYLIGFLLISVIVYSVAPLSHYGFTNSLIKSFHSNFAIDSHKQTTRIDHVFLDYPVVIRGTNLCSANKTVAINDTQFIIHSNYCHPIIVCSDTMVSCYLQGGLQKKSLMTKTINITRIRLSEKNSTSTVVTSSTVPYSTSVSYWEKNNIALVIHFNNAHYERIPLLNIYSDLFPSVFYTGPSTNPQVIECPEGNRGFRAYECLSRVVRAYPNYTGYLMIHFDLLPILNNLQKLNLSSIWIPGIGCVPRNKATGWWWDQGIGLRAMVKALDELKANSKNTTYHGRYLKNYQEHAGDMVCNSYSDIYYLPQRFTSDWLFLTGLHGHNDVFLEIAFGAITYMMIQGNLTSSMEVLSGITFGGGFSENTLSSNPASHFMHRLDLNSPAQQQLIEMMIRRSFLTNKTLERT